MSRDAGLDYLLDLNGEILVQEKGCWVKIEARKLKAASKDCPHGIKYSLTLHDKFGTRLPGFDNAHPIRSFMTMYIRIRVIMQILMRFNRLNSFCPIFSLK